MKFINFVNKFIAQPFGCSISAMPTRVANHLSHRKGSYVMKTKTIDIKLPRKIYNEDADSFPTLEDIVQYYETRPYGFERKPDAPKILVPFVIEYEEYKPVYVERAIQKALVDMTEEADDTCNRLDNDIYNREEILKKHTEHFEQGKKWIALQNQVNAALGFKVRIDRDWQKVGDEWVRYYNVEKLEKWIQSQHRAIDNCQERKAKLEANNKQLQELLLQF